MAVLKKHLTALHTRGKQGNIVKHAGKGATEQPLPAFNSSMNDYAKASPMPLPPPSAPADSDMAPYE